MDGIWQVVLALLAAAGCWRWDGRCSGGSWSRRGGAGAVYAVVPAAGDGSGLEQTVKGLLWLRSGDLARFTIVIADGGLDPAGRAAAAALLARDRGIVLCPADRLGAYIGGK